jgi:uncharacterized protein involved in tellurium resistance
MIEPGTKTVWQAFAATAGLYQDRPVIQYHGGDRRNLRH